MAKKRFVDASNNDVDAFMQSQKEKERIASQEPVAAASNAGEPVQAAQPMSIMEDVVDRRRVPQSEQHVKRLSVYFTEAEYKKVEMLAGLQGKSKAMTAHDLAMLGMQSERVQSLIETKLQEQIDIMTK